MNSGKLLSFLILGIFLLSFTSALTDNYLSYDEETETIIISNLFGLGADLEKATLLENICEDGRFCQAIKEIELYKEGILIEDFKTIRLDDNSNEEQNIRWHKFEYFGSIDDYETQCYNGETIYNEKNNTYYTEQICEKVKIGSHEGWIEFKEGDTFKEGKYLVKTSGEIRPGRVYDWQIKIQDKWTTPWATWGNISEGDEAEVILNSPADGSIAYVNPVTFNASANVTGGAYLVNASLWTDEEEWSLKDYFTTYISKSEPITIQSDDATITKDINGCTQTLFKNITLNKKFYNMSDTINSASDLTKGIREIKIYYEDGTDYTGSTGNIDIKIAQATYYVQNPYYWKNVKNVEIYMRNTNYCANTATMYERYTRFYGVSAIETNISKLMSKEGIKTWNVQVCDSDGDCGFATSNYTFSMDNTAPNIYLNYPTSLIDYGRVNGTLQLNISATDINLDKVWYNYNGTNITLTGAVSGIYNISNITLSEKNNVTIYANDTSGNLNSSIVSWSYKIFENGRWLNSSTYETATENYIISLSSNSSLTNVYLNYSNNSIPTTSSSGNWTYSRDAPIGTLGNQTINWIATYSGENISIPIYSYQNVLETVFTICNATYTNDALNLTFKDEANLNYINATIPTSTWTYYLGSGAVNKTYTYSSTTEQMNYVFCSSVDRNLNVNPYVQFKKGTDYPQRIWEPSTKQYNQSVIEQTLYLLSSTDGIYVTYQVLDGTGTQIGGVDVVAKRTINGEEFIVGIGQTDAAGAITFWMNPDFVHSITFSKEGYTTYTLNQFPTQTIYTITIGQTSDGDVTDYLRGITYQIKPPFGQTLNTSQLYNFNMTFNSSYWELDSFGFEIYGDNVLIGANSSTSPTGGYLQNILNISDYEHISMEIYWIINGTLTYGRNDGWFVFNYDEGTEWSVWTFFKDLSTYTDTEGGNGIFGLTQNGLNLIIFIIIFLVTGLVSYKFSVTSPAVVSGIIFAMVFLFDVGLGMIEVNVFGGVQYFPTIFMLIIMVALIIKEATQ